MERADANAERQCDTDARDLADLPFRITGTDLRQAEVKGGRGGEQVKD